MVVARLRSVLFPGSTVEFFCGIKTVRERSLASPHFSMCPHHTCALIRARLPRPYAPPLGVGNLKCYGESVAFSAMARRPEV
jgi:hypothetical protein